MDNNHKFPYRWTLKDANFTKDKGKVFSCFACGGGSTMGYKLAGFDVIGCNEIDPQMNACYVANHHPKFNYLCDIRDMVNAEMLPPELYQLDVLDGSPPCSTFSIMGNREEDWGVERKFREGQKSQVLDTLFFDFIALAKRLQPKVVIAENVMGIIQGQATKYRDKILEDFDKAGYLTKVFEVHTKDMGVPQVRNRVVFLSIRKDLAEKIDDPMDMFSKFPYIDMEFNEKEICYGEFADYKGKEITKGTKTRILWDNHTEEDNSLGDVCKRMWNRSAYYYFKFYDENKVPPTIVPADHLTMITKKKPVYLSKDEILLCSSFPLDYNATEKEIGYMCGMSVPPVMMAQVASRVYEYWLSKI